jgi:hypothetical protein
MRAATRICWVWLRKILAKGYSLVSFDHFGLPVAMFEKAGQRCQITT